MDSRFSSSRGSSRGSRLGPRARAVGLALALAFVFGLAGCGKQAVRASEKEFLADQTMVFDSDPHEATADEHISANREGSTGGRGTGGGGCGCN